MNEVQAEHEYLESLRNLLEQATAAGISAEEFHQLVDDSLNQIGNYRTTSRWKIFRNKKFIIIIIMFLLCIINCILNEKPLSLFLCKIQEFIYPGLKLLRIISIPIISFFPSLTELYDETCLIQNPFFRVNGMNCWPCYGVKEISEIVRMDEHFQLQTSPPFTFKTDQEIIKIEDLKKKYIENKKIFDENAYKMIINQKDTTLIKEFFENYNSTKSEAYKWRINRMLPALVIRTIFPRPKIIPRLGQSTERFILIDNPNSISYQLPEPECNYAFIIQSTGERLIEFQPAKECFHQCEPVSILLKESYLLWYNWWYWRPTSHSTDSNSTSISYMGSYC